jgi:hypothetical protein
MAPQEPESPARGADVPSKRGYVRPQLLRYGSVTALTRRVGTTGTLRDKAGNGTNKTR